MYMFKMMLQCSNLHGTSVGSHRWVDGAIVGKAARRHRRNSHRSQAHFVADLAATALASTSRLASQPLPAEITRRTQANQALRHHAPATPIASPEPAARSIRPHW